METATLTQKKRIVSIDIVRGLVMVIMALDHTRDFFHLNGFVYDATDLATTNVPLFFTRWITHFCAPVFVLLSGSAVRIGLGRKSKGEMASFLFTRGLWLIFLEVVIIRFSFFFNFYYDATVLQVIWVIGACMVAMSACVLLSSKVILWIGLVVTAGHNLLGGITLNPGDSFFIPWTLLYQTGYIPLSASAGIIVLYPVIPWLGIMLLGYSLGILFTPDYSPEKRQKLLIRMGLITCAAFIVIRASNLYGDPSPWAVQRNWYFTIMSFVNCTKYPVSLSYTLMTLGPSLLLLGWLDKVSIKPLSPLEIFGRVPLFYYIIHFFLIHISALALRMITDNLRLSEVDFHIASSFGGVLPGSGYNLWIVYVAWICIVLILYPLCKRYNTYKTTHTSKWLSYL